MVVPIGDAPNERSVPFVTYALIAANVAVYVLITVPLGAVRPDPRDPAVAEYVQTMTRALGDRVPVRELLANLSAYDLFVFAHGFRPAAPSLAALFVSMFLHGGLMHLVGNMLFLWIYGDNVEHRMGRGRYLLAYLGTGVAATLFHAVGDPRSPIPMVGASGAISGVLGFYFIWFPRNRVRLLALLPPFLMDVFEVRARLVLGLYLVADNLLPYLLVRSPGGVAHGAHIGGFIAGLAVAWVMNRRAVSGRPVEYRHPAAAPEDRGAIGQAIAAGRFAEAASEYFALPAHATRRVLAPEPAVALASWLRASGHVDAALVVLQRCLRDFPLGRGVADAHVLAGDLLLRELDQPASAYQHLLDALDLGPSPEGEAVARRGLGEIAARQKRNIGHPYRRRA
jgi:membrane associated rhomboid family serine protease